MLSHDVRKHKDMNPSSLFSFCVVAFVFLMTLFVFVGCSTKSPELAAKEKLQAAAEVAARRFVVLSKQVVESRKIYVLKDKETEVEYVMATYGESLVFQPLIRNEER